MSVYAEIKKYLLYLIGFFCLLLLGHLALLYVYHDATKYELTGGTFHLGIVDSPPAALSLLESDIRIGDDGADVMRQFLYRGLVRYSLSDKKIASDLGRCKIDGFPIVRCALQADAKWSDGSSVTPADVVASFAYFRENSKNANTKQLLSRVSVIEEEDGILATFTTRDATSIEALFLPIIRAVDVASNIDIITTDSVTNGPYVITEFDAKKNIYTLDRRGHYTHPLMTFFADKMRISFADSSEEFGRNMDLIIG
jgi:ABC-type oligopeptide transport system substrate-binding subunit